MRHKDSDWNLPGPRPNNWLQVQVAVLMDIRDQNKLIVEELKHLNRTFDCHNFQAVPGLLRRVASNTAKPRQKKAEK